MALPGVRTKLVATPSVSLTLIAGYRGNLVCLPMVGACSTRRSGLLRCSFLPTSSALSLSCHHSFAGSSLGFDFDTYTGGKAEKRRGLVVRAGKPALCLATRNRSRKSLARTHGFRVRMRTANRGLF